MDSQSRRRRHDPADAGFAAKIGIVILHSNSIALENKVSWPNLIPAFARTPPSRRVGAANESYARLDGTLFRAMTKRLNQRAGIVAVAVHDGVRAHIGERLDRERRIEAAAHGGKGR